VGEAFDDSCQQRSAEGASSDAQARGQLLLDHLEFLESDAPVIEPGVERGEFTEHRRLITQLSAGSVPC
jgi:hypothetical protein